MAEERRPWLTAAGSWSWATRTLPSRTCARLSTWPIPSFLAGCLALRKEHFQEAATHLTATFDRHDHLGRHFSKYGIAAEIRLSITDEVSAHVGPDIRRVLLALVEAHQALGCRQEAIHCLRRLRSLEPDDVIVRLSLAEFLLEAVATGAGDEGAPGMPSPWRFAAPQEGPVRMR